MSKHAHHCPFCGSLHVEVKKLNYRDEYYFVECDACHAKGPMKDFAWQAKAAWEIRRSAHKLPPQEPRER
jgi:hypothetical protein